VDGRAARAYQVDYVLRGVPVGAGAHTVTFTYEPTSWRVGWIVSVLALVAVVAALLGGWRRRRRLERRVSWAP
jgi:MYXO-CTERM domain-containing protein